MRSYVAGYTVICFVRDCWKKKKILPFWMSSFQRLRFLLMYAESPGGDIRYLRMLCPPGTGSWQNWELSMDQEWWEPSCWWWSRCSWGPGCYCSNLWGPFYSLLQLAHGTCFPDIPYPPSLFHSSGSGCHCQHPTQPSPCAFGNGIFVPLPLVQLFCSSCGVHWYQSFCLHSL